MQGSTKKKAVNPKREEIMESLEESDPLEFWKFDRICQQKDEAHPHFL